MNHPPQSLSTDELSNMAPIICIHGDFIIRGEVRDGALNLFVHRYDGASEYLPRGYMLGSNSLIFKPPPLPENKDAIPHA